MSGEDNSACNPDVIVQTPLHPSTVPQAPQLGKQPLTEESTRGKGEGSERLHPDDTLWPDRIRDLIKHENELINNRVTWMLTFHGFLFAALAFAWDKYIEGIPVLGILCWAGSLQACFALIALIQAHIAIRRLLWKWKGYTVDREKISQGWEKTIPPIWGWVEIGRPGYCKIVLEPSFCIACLLIVIWGWITFCNLCRPEPLQSQWQSRVEENIYKALTGEDKSKDDISENEKVTKNMEQAVSVLTHIRGNTNDGKRVFGDHCVRCHGDDGQTKKSENSGTPTLDLLKKDKPEEYDLVLRPYATTVDDLPNSCSKIVIIAFIGTSLHIRIFDADGKKVVDKAESKLTNGEMLITLKELLHNYSNEASLSQEKKQELRQKIIRKATLIAGYTHREKIIRGILYPNSHWATRNGPEDMENGIATRILPQEFIDVVEYLEHPDKNGVVRTPSGTPM